jgi:hypothetical protein
MRSTRRPSHSSVRPVEVSDGKRCPPHVDEFGRVAVRTRPYVARWMSAGTGNRRRDASRACLLCFRAAHAREVGA